MACSTRSAASASRRWRANTASSVNTIVPPTAMLRASIVLVNHVGQRRRDRAQDLAGDPRSEEHDDVRDVPADRRPDVAEHERAERGEDPPQADAAGVEEPAERDHRQRRREQDVDLADAEQPREVARAREHDDRTEQDGEVHERHQPDRRSEREIQRSPQRRDRQDQHRDQDEQRLASAQVLVVVGIRADKRQARGDAIHEVHRGRRYWRGAIRPRDVLERRSPRVGLGPLPATQDDVHLRVLRKHAPTPGELLITRPFFTEAE